jgi:hypothetical protein
MPGILVELLSQLGVDLESFSLSGFLLSDQDVALSPNVSDFQRQQVRDAQPRVDPKDKQELVTP